MTLSRLSLSAALASTLSLTFITGCAVSDTASPIAATGLTIQGNVHGGQQPIVGAHVYLFAANTTGYGQPSVSLLSPTITLLSDSVGAYVLTNAQGSFTLTGDYTCTVNTQVYVYALGGNTGSGPNSASGLLASLGNCPASGTFATTTPYVYVNEVSTVATAFTLAGYAVDATHVSSSGTALAATGIANAMANATNLVTLSTGVALTQTPAGNGVVPQALINTIANILAACVNSNTPTTGNCGVLFANARAQGSTGTIASDTASAAINIAHNPGSNVAALYGMIPPSTAFSPALASRPNDFTVGLTFSGGGVDGPYAVAIDAHGDAWFTNLNNSAVSKFSPTGAPQSPSTGFTAGNQQGPAGVAIDLSENAWIPDGFTNSITVYNSSGGLVSPAGGYTGGGLASPQAIAIDGTGNAWVPNFANASISKFSSAGVALSPSTGFVGGGVSRPQAISVDTTGSVWVANQSPDPGTISKFTNAGVAISSSAGFGMNAGIKDPFAVPIDANNNVWIPNFNGNSVSELNSTGVAVSTSAGFTGGGLSAPYGASIDGAGNIWVANSGNSSVTELTNSGGVVSPATGYTGGAISVPNGIAVDGSGDLWISNSTNMTVTEIIGAAVPVVTPLSAGIKNSMLGTKP